MSKKELVAAVLRETGLKHHELAAKLNLSTSTVARWAIGLRQPSGSAVLLLRQLLEKAGKAVPA